MPAQIAGGARVQRGIAKRADRLALLRDDQLRAERNGCAGRRGDNGCARDLPVLVNCLREGRIIAQPLDEDANLAAAGEANLLDVLLFRDAKFEELWCASANGAHAFFDDRWLDAAAAHRSANLAALTDGQRRAETARRGAGNGDNGGKRDALARRVPTLYIGQYISHERILPPGCSPDEERCTAIANGRGQSPGGCATWRPRCRLCLPLQHTRRAERRAGRRVAYITRGGSGARHGRRHTRRATGTRWSCRHRRRRYPPASRA